MKAIMICSMWLAVAVVGWNAPDAGVAIAVFAMVATIVLSTE